MQQQLFSHVDIDPKNAYIPNGRAPDLKVECERYERTIKNVGGLALTFLGLGSNGHIAFNEPGTPFDSRTHVVALSESTRKANAAFFLDLHLVLAFDSNLDVVTFFQPQLVNHRDRQANG